MASRRHDNLLDRNLDGSVNLYDRGKSTGTACEKGLAARIGGHTWNILNNDDANEAYFAQVRNPEHPFFLGDRKTKYFFPHQIPSYPADPRGLMFRSLEGPAPHRREDAIQQRRREVQLAQIENSGSYRGFQNRCSQMFAPNPPKRYSIENKRHVYETEKLCSRGSPKQEWIQRRSEKMMQSQSCPSVDIRDPARSLDGAMRADPRKQLSQLQTESDKCLIRYAQNGVGMSLDATAFGRSMASQQNKLSVHRVENHDWSIKRNNNHFSGEDRVTRSDPYYRRPGVGITNNSVKYDILNNQRKWFKY
jgi:hypothetical protein